MENIKKYYENTKDACPHFTTKQFIKMNIAPKNAIDLGCGAGRDTVFLIKNGWNVLAIDKEELKKFRFYKSNFEDLKLENNSLVVANFSIPFCDKNYFLKFWDNITNSILKDGYFVGNFFGLNDSWVELKNNMVFLSKDQVIDLFNDFEIISFKEIEKDALTGLNKMKHWHIFNVIAKKK